ncbi:MAG: hypothetical protein ABR578_04115 [Chromatocurvus sp.]
METSCAILGIGEIGVDAVQTVFQLLLTDGDVESPDGAVGALIVRDAAGVCGAGTQCAPISMADDIGQILAQQDLVLLISDVSDNRSTATVARIIEQALSAAEVPYFVISAATGGSFEQAPQKVAHLRGEAHAAISLRKSNLEIPLGEELARTSLALLPFAMLGRTRACLDFCDLADLVSTVHGNVRVSITRLPVAALDGMLPEDQFLEMMADLHTAPSGVYLAVGGRPDRLMDELENACASMLSAIDTAFPEDAPGVLFSFSCFLDETLGDHVEVVTCFSSAQ